MLVAVRHFDRFFNTVIVGVKKWALGGPVWFWCSPYATFGHI